MATHGEIRWPPVGTFDGRLRGDSHGRRHTGSVSFSAGSQRRTRARIARVVRAKNTGAAKRTSRRSAVPQAVRPEVVGVRKLTEERATNARTSPKW